MKKQRIILIIVSITFLTSCGSIIKLMYGVKKPQLETVETLTEFLSQICVPTENLYFCKDSISFLKVMKSSPGFPDAEFFDCNGNFIPYRNTTESCNAGIDSFINQLLSNKTFATGFENISSRLVHFWDAKENKPISLNLIEKSDYYVLFYFTKYSGKKLNKEHITIWINEIEKLNQKGHLKMTYLLVSLDFMDYWGAGFSDTKLRISGFH